MGRRPRRDLDRQRFGRGAQRCLANGLGLEEIPGIGGLDVELDADRLRTLAERFRDREQRAMMAIKRAIFLF